MKLLVYIEISGKQVLAGDIAETDRDSYGFLYSDSYMDSGVLPISISLPFSKERYSAEKTRNFFEGLLPEGFTRRAVAGRLHIDENDYISLLKALGQECLGAIRVVEAGSDYANECYQKLTVDQVKALAAEGAAKSAELIAQSHLSLTGASGKVGLYWNKITDEWFLPGGTAPSTHIVKQSHIRYKHIVTNEQLCMRTAGKLGIDIPESFIVNTHNAMDDEVLFATKRFDRVMDEDCPVVGGLKRPHRLHQEDFALALGIPASEKYERSGELYLKRAFRLLADNTADPITDQIKLWDLIVFDYLIGNTDNHLKNISLVYDKEMKRLALAPAYDIISTVIYEGTATYMSVAIGGVLDINEINESHFADCAAQIGLGSKLAMKRFELMKNRIEEALRDTAMELAYFGFIQAPIMADKIMSLRAGI